MKIAEGKDVKLGIFDIECFKELWDIGIYNPDTKEWVEFELSQWRNDIDKFVKFYLDNDFDYWVSYNGINYDHQVLEYIVKYHQRWYNKTNLEICALLSEFSGKVIEDKNYGIRLPFQEETFRVKPLDVMRINHFDNENKRISLKWCEFHMNMSVEEMPVHFLKEGLTQDEIKGVQKYRRHDVLATLGVLYITIGDPDKILELNGGIPVDHLKDYKGQNKIQDRFDVMEETGMNCLNWSDVKIGEEWNKKDYMEAEGITDERKVYPINVKVPWGKKYKKYFPNTVDFETEELKQFVDYVGNQVVRVKKQEYPVTFGNTTYTIAKGGIHSKEKNRMIIPPEGYILRDSDVGSQYPNSIVKYAIYPDHLKATILQQFQGRIKRRIEYKKKAKQYEKEGDMAKSRFYNSLQGMFKLCMNGGYYGKLGQNGSFLETQEGLLKVCMGNQLEILMAIEMMEKVGFQVVSGNTDGFVTLFPASREEDFKKVCEQWEIKVGNHELGKLEYTDFDGLWQEGINSYIAKKPDGKVKKKGRFVTDYGSPGCEIHKNKSKRVIPLALEQYFIHGKDPIEFIRNHDNIFDFLVAKKAAVNSDLHYEELLENGKVNILRKLTLYYVSTNGNVIKKRGWHKDENGNDCYMDDYCEAPPDKAPELGTPKMTYFNEPFFLKNFSDYNVNYDFYIYQCLTRIDAIEKTKKAENFLKTLRPHKQTSLF